MTSNETKTSINHRVAFFTVISAMKRALKMKEIGTLGMSNWLQSSFEKGDSV